MNIKKYHFHRCLATKNETNCRLIIALVWRGGQELHLHFAPHTYIVNVHAFCTFRWIPDITCTCTIYQKWLRNTMNLVVVCCDIFFFFLKFARKREKLNEIATENLTLLLMVTFSIMIWSIAEQMCSTPDQKWWRQEGLGIGIRNLAYTFLIAGGKVGD